MNESVIGIFNNEKWQKKCKECFNKKSIWIWWKYLPQPKEHLNLRKCSGLYDEQGYKDILDTIT